MAKSLNNIEYIASAMAKVFLSWEFGEYHTTTIGDKILVAIPMLL